MGWHEFLRLERKRKLGRIRIMMSGSSTVAAVSVEALQSLEREIIAEYRSQVAEIEQMLDEAGEPYEA